MNLTSSETIILSRIETALRHLERAQAASSQGLWDEADIERGNAQSTLAGLADWMTTFNGDPQNVLATAEKMTLSVVQKAVLAERERCAKIVEESGRLSFVMRADVLAKKIREDS